MTPRPIVLTIAGSDPSGGAGIQSDLRTIHSLGAIGTSVITALTAQNTHGVSGVFPVDGTIIACQLQVLLDDILPDAVKIGMLGSMDQTRAVINAIKTYGLQNIVLDPVLASTGGVPLLDDNSIDVLLKELMPLCAVISPNIGEAIRLTGIAIHNMEDMERAAKHLIKLGANAVIIKGGHLPGIPTDVLVFPDDAIERLSSARIETSHTHGTGCLYSSALAVFLAQGMTLKEALYAAKDVIYAALERPVVEGGGRGYPEIPHPARSSPPSPANGEKDRVRTIVTGPSFLTSVSPSPINAPLVAGRRGRGMRGPIYLVTDPKLRPDRSHLDVTRAALEGGVRIIQLRDKYASARKLIEMGRAMAALCHDYDAFFIVNDRVDIALACNADGVHLGPEDMHPAEARELLGPDKIIGVSINSVEEAATLIPYATYLGVGAIFGSRTKADAGDPIGVGRIREIKAAFPDMPLVAIGGINHGNIADVFAAGADSAAVVSAIICAGDMMAASRVLVAAK